MKLLTMIKEDIYEHVAKFGFVYLAMLALSVIFSFIGSPHSNPLIAFVQFLYIGSIFISIGYCIKAIKDLYKKASEDISTISITSKLIVSIGWICITFVVVMLTIVVIANIGNSTSVRDLSKTFAYFQFEYILYILIGLIVAEAILYINILYINRMLVKVTKLKKVECFVTIISSVAFSILVNGVLISLVPNVEREEVTMNIIHVGRVIQTYLSDLLVPMIIGLMMSSFLIYLGNIGLIKYNKAFTELSNHQNKK